MIVLEEKRIVILTPPHTASGNLHRALCSPEVGGVWAVGLTPDGAVYDHHTIHVSAGWCDFTVALVVRNPLDRLIGLHEHHCRAGEKHGWQALPWWEFVARVLARDSALSWFYRSTISELIGPQRIDHVLRFESLTPDLTALLGRYVELPAGETEGHERSEYYRQLGVCRMAEWWGREDAARFGYQTQPGAG